jgi:hypothetical protein
MFIASGPLLVPLPDFAPQPSASARCQMTIPKGTTLLNVDLYFSVGATAATKAQIVAQVANIKLTVNSKTKFELTGAQAVAREEFYRTGSVSPGDNGILPLTFHRPWMQTENESVSGFSNQDGPAWGTVGLNSVQIEVTMASAAVTIDTLRAWVSQSGPEQLGKHVTVLKHLDTFASASEQRITQLPRGTGLQLYALHITSSAITSLRIVADRTEILNATRAVLHHNLLNAGRTVQTGYTHIDFVNRNRHSDALTMNMAEFDLYITWSGAPGAFSIIMEYVEDMPIQQVAA